MDDDQRRDALLLKLMKSKPESREELKARVASEKTDRVAGANGRTAPSAP